VVRVVSDVPGVLAALDAAPDDPARALTDKW